MEIGIGDPAIDSGQCKPGGIPETGIFKKKPIANFSQWARFFIPQYCSGL